MTFAYEVDDDNWAFCETEEEARQGAEDVAEKTDAESRWGDVNTVLPTLHFGSLHDQVEDWWLSGSGGGVVNLWNQDIGASDADIADLQRRLQAAFEQWVADRGVTLETSVVTIRGTVKP